MPGNRKHQVNFAPDSKSPGNNLLQALGKKDSEQKQPFDMEPFYEGGQASPSHGESNNGSPMKGLSALFSKPTRSAVTTPNEGVVGARSESETILEGIKAS